jgi:hypothetical protein
MQYRAWYNNIFFATSDWKIPLAQVSEFLSLKCMHMAAKARQCSMATGTASIGSSKVNSRVYESSNAVLELQVMARLLSIFRKIEKDNSNIK